MLPNDTLSNVLYIDLSKRSFQVVKRADLFEKCLGGSGVAIELLREQCPKGAEPLSQDNPVVFAVGPLTGLYPLASKTVAMFKSPLTRNLGESHAGGRSAVSIRLAGYGAIVIQGASASPVYIAIHGEKVFFRDASTLWGMRSSFTAGRILREREPAQGFRTIMRIGRAGEKRVSFACVTTETYRHFGRLGLGAVLGAKKIKALVVSGKRSLPVADKKAYQEVYRKVYQGAVKSPLMQKYHDLGTAGNILPLNKLKGLPTRNLRQSHFEGAEALSGERMAEEYLGRRVACSHCPVGCIHLAALREPSKHEPYFYKTSMIGYDYEPIYALGTLLGGSDPAGMLKLMETVEAWGLDAMSTGVILAWATEAMEQGLISERETEGVALRWGGYEDYIKAVQKIVEQPNEFFKSLAGGVKAASAKYGGQEFALAFGHTEMAGYHTGPASYLNFLSGSRHSHLDSAGYSLDQRALTEGKAFTPSETAKALLSEERWRQILSTLVVCFFARGLYTKPVAIRALQTAGFDKAGEELDRLGIQIHRNKYSFKKREGFSLKALEIPRRILEVPTPAGPVSEDFLRESMKFFEEQILSQ